MQEWIMEVVGFVPAVAAMYKCRRDGTEVLVRDTAFCNVICVVIMNF
jgi:hypothetical protein